MSTYKDAGVDIDAGDLAVALMKASIAKASRPEVMGGIGGFAGLFDASALKKFNKPLLATSTDGVGTKTEIARALGKYDTIGEDLVAMVVDDLVVCGAEPLDHDEFDIAGAATGAVDADKLLSADQVRKGDVIIAMPSSGFHANGFSLVRHIIKTKKLSLEAHVSEYGKSSGEVFLTPTEIYTLDCLALIKVLEKNLRTFSHITGGGIAENTARVIPQGLSARYDRSTWSLPVEMEYMAAIGGVPQGDMERTWNCGIGMVAIVDPSVADLAIKSLSARGMKAWIAGDIQSSQNLGSHSSYLEGSYKK
jgi:phosphoribosylformylglycinamidine cyclo-ligase